MRSENDAAFAASFQSLQGAIRRNLIASQIREGLKFQSLQGAIRRRHELSGPNLLVQFQSLQGAIRSIL